MIRCSGSSKNMSVGPRKDGDPVFILEKGSAMELVTFVHTHKPEVGA